MLIPVRLQNVLPGVLPGVGRWQTRSSNRWRCGGSVNGLLFLLTTFLMQHVVVFFQPGSYLRPEFLMRATTHHYADVSEREHEVVFVRAAHQVRQRQARLWVDDVIVLTQDVEHGASDAPQVNCLAADPELTLSEEVVLQEVACQLAENLPGQRDVAVHPTLKQL